MQFVRKSAASKGPGPVPNFGGTKVRVSFVILSTPPTPHLKLPNNTSDITFITTNIPTRQQKALEIVEGIAGIQESFEHHVDRLRKLDYDVLDVRVSKWHDDYNQFKNDVKVTCVLLISRKLIISCLDTFHTLHTPYLSSSYPVLLPYSCLSSYFLSSSIIS
jgi:hypothetical protein